MEQFGTMFDFCKAAYGIPGFDLTFYVKLGPTILTPAGYKAITGKDYVAAQTAEYSSPQKYTIHNELARGTSHGLFLWAGVKKGEWLCILLLLTPF